MLCSSRAQAQSAAAAAEASALESGKHAKLSHTIAALAAAQAAAQSFNMVRPELAHPLPLPMLLCRSLIFATSSLRLSSHSCMHTACSSSHHCQQVYCPQRPGIACGSMCWQLPHVGRWGLIRLPNLARPSAGQGGRGRERSSRGARRSRRAARGGGRHCAVRGAPRLPQAQGHRRGERRRRQGAGLRVFKTQISYVARAAAEHVQLGERP
jgi:hypothetical protein